MRAPALAVLLSSLAACAGGQVTPEKGPLVLAGWTVHVHPSLREDAATTRRLEQMQRELEEIVRTLPAAAVRELRKVPLWVSPEYPGFKPLAEYHPGAGWLRAQGRDVGMAGAVEFTDVRTFEAESDRMPWLVLHELAHGFYFRVLGAHHAEIREAWQRARDAGLYDKVERRFGGNKPSRRERAYAIQDPMEYFAESSEAYFGRNDFYPFTRTELQAHDPEMARLVARLWGIPETP